MSRTVIEPLADLIRREVPVHLLYGREDGEYREYVAACHGTLGQVIASGPGVEELVVPGHVHSLLTTDVQREFVMIVTTFALDRLTASTA